MQFICNELSFLPLANTSHLAEQRFVALLKVFQSAKERYSFTHIRFPQNYAQIQVTTTQAFFDWVVSLTNKNLKDLVLALCRPPFMDDLEEAEINSFFQSNYEIIDEGVPVNDSPIGLPIAHIKSTPAISLHSDNFWLKRKINMRKTNGDEVENAEFFAYNICVDEDVNSVEITEWADNHWSLTISDADSLKKYLAFKKYQIAFEGDFVEQLLQWKASDINTYKYILLLMKDVEIHPFSGGMGQTENLRYRGKEASKRINQVDRLSYTVANNIVTFLSCMGHYDFH